MKASLHQVAGAPPTQWSRTLQSALIDMRTWDGKPVEQDTLEDPQGCTKAHTLSLVVTTRARYSRSVLCCLLCPYRSSPEDLSYSRAEMVTRGLPSELPYRVLGRWKSITSQHSLEIYNLPPRQGSWLYLRARADTRPHLRDPCFFVFLTSS